MTIRLIKTCFSAMVGLFLGLIFFNNVTDYGSNFEFVEKVTGMGDTFAFQANKWRSINSNALHHLFYIGIILLEGTIATFCLWGAYQMATKVKAEDGAFQLAKTKTTIGLSLGILLWFFVFGAIAGEWFLMWQSDEWNAQDTAYFLTGIFLLFLIFHTQKEG